MQARLGTTPESTERLVCFVAKLQSSVSSPTFKEAMLEMFKPNVSALLVQDFAVLGSQLCVALVSLSSTFTKSDVS